VQNYKKKGKKTKKMQKIDELNQKNRGIFGYLEKL